MSRDCRSTLLSVILIYKSLVEGLARLLGNNKSTSNISVDYSVSAGRTRTGTGLSLTRQTWLYPFNSA